MKGDNITRAEWADVSWTAGEQVPAWVHLVDVPPDDAAADIALMRAGFTQGYRAAIADNDGYGWLGDGVSGRTGDPDTQGSPADVRDTERLAWAFVVVCIAVLVAIIVWRLP
jgi:hypothetical protein